MFSGIVKSTGTIIKIYKGNNNCVLEIFSKIKFLKEEIGSSISCSGVCLTLENFSKNLVKFYVSKETLSKTIFQSSKKTTIILYIGLKNYYTKKIEHISPFSKRKCADMLSNKKLLFHEIIKT